jgi:DNA-binding MarR family transcriptional regulator
LDPTETSQLTTLDQTIERFWETFSPLWTSIRTHLRTIAMDNFGISVEQFHILRHIRHGVRSVSELAEVKKISRPAISQAVDILVEKGLIERTPSQEDRRFIQLALTESGLAMLDDIFERNRRWMKEQMTGLTPEELCSIQLAMNALKKAFLENLE